MKKADLLKEALHIVEKRGLNYGKPENNFARIASLWSVYFNQRGYIDETDFVSETDVAILMVLMKVGRLMETPNHLDSWMDIAGYAACGAEVSRAGEDPAIMGFTPAKTDDIIRAAFDLNFPLDVQGDPGDETGPTDELAPAIHVQHQVRPLKVGDAVVSKLPYESSWRGTVIETTGSSLNGPFVLVEWRVDSAAGSTPWRRWVATSTLEHAAVA